MTAFISTLIIDECKKLLQDVSHNDLAEAQRTVRQIACKILPEYTPELLAEQLKKEIVK